MGIISNGFILFLRCILCMFFFLFSNSKQFLNIAIAQITASNPLNKNTVYISPFNHASLFFSPLREPNAHWPSRVTCPPQTNVGRLFRPGQHTFFNLFWSLGQNSERWTWTFRALWPTLRWAHKGANHPSSWTLSRTLT